MIFKVQGNVHSVSLVQHPVMGVQLTNSYIRCTSYPCWHALRIRVNSSLSWFERLIDTASEHIT